MTSLLALLDSGTTRTRLRLWWQGVIWSGERRVGAKDVAAEGDNRRLRVAVAELLEEARQVADLEAIVASGMITSDVGLVVVPHLSTPAGLVELAQGVVIHDFPDLGRIHFIPGLKTLPPVLNASTLHLADVLRGEEVEVVGLWERLRLAEPVSFLHFGSHHKVVDCDADGHVLASRTALTGEALEALSRHTILASSVLPSEAPGELDPALWRAGLEAAQRHGFGRALFMVRLGQQLWGCSQAELRAFLVGALDSLTLPLLPHPPARLVLYGRSGSAAHLGGYLEGQGYTLTRVEPAEAEQAAASGAARVYELYRDGRARVATR